MSEEESKQEQAERLDREIRDRLADLRELAELHPELAELNPDLESLDERVDALEGEMNALWRQFVMTMIKIAKDPQLDDHEAVEQMGVFIDEAMVRQDEFRTTLDELLELALEEEEEEKKKKDG